MPIYGANERVNYKGMLRGFFVLAMAGAAALAYRNYDEVSRFVTCNVFDMQLPECRGPQ